MFWLLIDTCVWLDLAKDSNQHATLSALEELIEQGKVLLILPRIIVDEFQRNKQRIAEESGRSLSSIFKRVKEAVERFGDKTGKRAILNHLNDVDHRIPMMGEAACSAIARVERLFGQSDVIETSDELKLRAVQRAIEKRAPFHRARNGFDDAIIIEAYVDAIRTPPAKGRRFAFITHNTKDFSDPRGSDLKPHPDIAEYFSRVRSIYSTSLVKVLQRVAPEVVSESMFLAEEYGTPRMLSEILAEEDRLCNLVWYNRHQVWLEKIADGRAKIVPDREWTPQSPASHTKRSIYLGARRAARALEEQYGRKNLGPWSDFEWGMINGELSGLRWILGYDWGMLDT